MSACFWRSPGACAALVVLLQAPLVSADVIRFDGSSAHNPLSSIVRFGLSPETAEPVALRQPVRTSRTRQTTALKPISPSPTVHAAIRAAASRYAHAGVLHDLGLTKGDWPLFLQAMIRVESGYRQDAVSGAGAIGLAQLMPATAKDLGVDPNNTAQNLDGGARYLLAQMQAFGSLELALAAYNAGPTAVSKYGGIPPYAETRAHVRKVMAEFERLKSLNTSRPARLQAARTSPQIEG